MSRSLGATLFITFPAIEIYAFHFATAPGTFGRDRAPAFADSYYMTTNEPQVARAGGITLYTLQKGTWERRRVWRKANGKSLQYGIAMGDLDGDKVNDFVLAFREKGPALVWYRRTKTGWERRVIEPATLHGGVFEFNRGKDGQR